MEFQFAPDFLNLLVETIPRLSRSKKDVLLFFQGAGVPSTFTSDLYADLARDKNSHHKFGLARTVLVRINEIGDAGLAMRREVVKRVVEFEDFTRCWESDVLEAKGLVSEVQRLVNVKDSFTRINIERKREQEKSRLAHEAEVLKKKQRAEKVERAKQKLFALFSIADAQRRGKLLEGALNDLFSAFDILIREAFTVRTDAAGVVEQVDGVIELDGYLYLVEMKWWNHPLGPGDTAQHLVRLFARDGARGLFISANGFTPAAIDQYREALRQRVVMLCSLEEFVNLLNKGEDVAEYLNAKVKRVVMDKNPLG